MGWAYLSLSWCLSGLTIKANKHFYRCVIVVIVNQIVVKQEEALCVLIMEIIQPTKSYVTAHEPRTKIYASILL